MSLYDLLPPNATTLERDFSRATSSLERIGLPVGKIRTAKRIDIPDSVVPWLIYEYGLNELLPYLGNNQRQALAEGVLWQRIRGTPQALKTALRWIGFAPFVEESEAGTLRWAEFQLGLDQAPDDLNVTNGLIGVSRLSAPVRSNLFRVYSGYDHRRFLLDDHGLSSGSWLCDHTGVYLRPDWPQLSFGRKFLINDDYSDDGVGELGIERIHGMLGLYEDRFTLSNSQLDEFWHLSDVGIIVRSRMIEITHGPLPGPGTNWTNGTWDSVLGWNTTNSVLPPLKFAKAGLYLSDAATLDDTNACFSARTEEEYGAGPFLLSEGDPTTGFNILSQHESWTEYDELLERFDRDHSAVGVAAADVASHVTVSRERCRIVDGLDDQFLLDQHLLGEFPPVLDLQTLSRNHALNLLGAPVDPDTWASQIDWLPYPNDVARPSWESFITWEDGNWDGVTDPAQVARRRPLWADAYAWGQLAWSDLEAIVPAWDHHPTWGDAGPWQSLYTSSAQRQYRAGLYLSDSDLLGSSNAVLGFAEEQRFDRGYQTTSSAHTPGGNLAAHTRETARVLDYQDSFTLDLHLLGEFPVVQDLQTLSRNHALNLLGAPVDPNTWASQIDWLPYPHDVARPAWQTLITWADGNWDSTTDPAIAAQRRPHWLDAYAWNGLAWNDYVADVPVWDHHPTWADAGPWQSLYSSFAGRQLRAGIYLSDSDPLGSSNAVLGFAEEQRYERSFASAGPVENRQGFATSQHTRTSQTEIARFLFTDWSQANWAGDGAEAWATGGEVWGAASWTENYWSQGAAGFWNDNLWAQRVAWNPTSLQIASAHSRYADGIHRFHASAALAAPGATSQHTRSSHTSFRHFTLAAWEETEAWTTADTPDWQAGNWTGDDTDAWTEGSQPWPYAGWAATDWMLGVANGWASTEPWIDQYGQPWLPTDPNNDAAWNPTYRFVQSHHQTLT